MHEKRKTMSLESGTKRVEDMSSSERNTAFQKILTRLFYLENNSGARRGANGPAEQKVEKSLFECIKENGFGSKPSP